MATEIHAVTGTMMLTQFMNAFSYRMTITKISCFQTSQADTYSGLRPFIAERLQPIRKGLFANFGLIAENFDHDPIVA